MRRQLEGLHDKKDIIKCAMECMQSEVNKLTNDHTDHLKRLFESHHSQISETKKKQWVGFDFIYIIIFSCFVFFCFSVLQL